MVSFPHVSTPNPVYVFPRHRACYMPAHLIFLDFTPRTIFGEQYRSLSSSLCSFLHSPVTSSPLGTNILLNTPFSNTLSLRSSLNVRDQVSHPYKARDKNIFLYFLNFILTQVVSQPRNSPHFMEPESSLLHSQVTATCPYPEPARSTPYPHITFPENPY